MGNKSTTTEQQAVLHKTDCYTAVAVLKQLLKEEKEAADATSSVYQEGKHYDNIRDIAEVLKLIIKRQATAV